MNDLKRMIYLLRQHADDIATDAELKQLETLLKTTAYDEATISLLTEVARETELLPSADEERLTAIWKKIKEPQSASVSTPGKLIRPGREAWWWAAAGLLLSIGSLTFLFINQKQEPLQANTKVHEQLENDLAPGGNKAVLTLSNGVTIILDTAQNGELARQGNTQVIKMDNGQLAYNSGNSSATQLLYNTLTTPTGGQYKLVLPDGTEVWLNAASSISYPTAFAGTERNVTLAGEAYFEVAKNATMPFKVQVNEMKVEVLGTHFNINAYNDEPDIKTTLLEGSVKLSNDNTNRLLQPGQQGRLNKSGAIAILENANTEEAVAWKNGVFQFDDADIKTVMRQIARWYDVEVEFKGNINAGKFVGAIPRNSNISEVFKILELSNVHFKLEGKKIIVLP